MSIFEQQLEKVKSETGFIAALDQSGGSTPKALKIYGVNEDAYSNDDQMFDQVHQTSKSFSGERILGANVVPFLKVDKGLADEDNGVQLMKPMPALDSLLEKAVKQNVFGTKMRSVIKTRH